MIFREGAGGPFIIGAVEVLQERGRQIWNALFW